MSAPRPPRSALWFGALVLGGCGDGPDGPALPMGKLPPTLVREQAGRTYDAWIARADAKDPRVAAEALWALAELAQEPAALLPRVRAALASPDVHLRHAGAVAAGRLLSRGAAALAGDLAARLADPERRIAQVAQAGLLDHGAGSAPALTAAVGSADEEHAAAAVRFLASLPDLARSTRPEDRLRSPSAKTLVAALGPGPGTATAALAEAALRGSLAFHLDVMRALDALGSVALPEVVGALPRATVERQVSLVNWIGSRGAAAAPYAVTLVQRLGAASAETDPSLAQALEDAVVAIGPEALPALEAAPPGPGVARALEQLRAP